MRKPLIVLGVLLVLLAVSMTPAGAKKPLEVDFEVTTFFAPPGELATGFFTASGDAVNEGVMCPGGDKIDIAPEKWAGNPDKVINGQVLTEFTCGEGGPHAGDTFVIKMQLHIPAGSPTWTVNWTVMDGTGAFADLHGSGRGEGSVFLGPDPGPPIGAIDLLNGGLHSK